MEPFPRGSGVLLSVTSLPSRYGIGDFGSRAYRWIDLLTQTGQKYWQILPLNPQVAGSGESPYFSSCVFAGNPLLISLEALAQENYLDDAVLKMCEKPDSDRIDYEAVQASKMHALSLAFDRFMKSQKPSEYDAFCSEHAWWLHDYALFLCLGAKYRTFAWDTWPQDVRDRQPDVLAEERKSMHRSMEEIFFQQYCFFKQWTTLKRYCNDKGISIIGDMPIYVNYQSVDVWAHPTYFKLDDYRRPTVVSGVPPDYFSPTGQLWNNPVYDWEALTASGYEWWIKRMRMNRTLYDMVRIDHFRGLVDYWEIPAGQKNAIQGRWVSAPTNDFFDTVLEQVPSLKVIAEDLGMITQEVTNVMERYGFPGMRVLQFAFIEDNPKNPHLPHNYSRNTVVFTGTHDNNTTFGWFEEEASQAVRQRLFDYTGKSLDGNEAVWTLIRLAMMSVADLAIIPLQDYLSLPSRNRMNTPSQHTGNNWRFRCTDASFESVPWNVIDALTYLYGRE